LIPGETDMMETALRLGVAAVGGLAVGVEREWSSGRGERAPRFAGVRTFLLLGLIGGVAAELHGRGQLAAGALLLGAASALVVAAYVMAARGGDVDGTTEVAALLVLAIGGLAGSGRLVLASALSALTALVLVEKTRIHSFVLRMEPSALQAGARFAVLALVVLPLLPAGPYGPPPGLRPRELWALVLLFSGLSFAGFIALRAFGSGRGHGVTGLLGGLVSSTVVTLNFARESRHQPKLGRALALGVIAACTVLYVRVGVLSSLLNPAVGRTVAPLLAGSLLVGVLIAALLVRRQEPMPAETSMPGNPLRLAAAVQMALAFQVVLYVVAWASNRFGSSGVLASSAVLGLTDVDALTYSMAKLGAGSATPDLAARGLAVGIVSNTAFKLALAVIFGRGTFRRLAGAGLAALAGAGLAILFFY
jgi:uncharacterized membrane protein (DUF4010 family)